VKAGLRTLTPVEQKYIEEEPKVSKQVHLQLTFIICHSSIHPFDALFCLNVQSRN
ncbi:hypothetical protein XENOCAPTIV_028349, partial [Xenoophorus captivus]